MTTFAVMLQRDLFSGIELEEEGNPFIDLDVGVRDMLGNMLSLLRF